MDHAYGYLDPSSQHCEDRTQSNTPRPPPERLGSSTPQPQPNYGASSVVVPNIKGSGAFIPHGYHNTPMRPVSREAPPPRITQPRGFYPHGAAQPSGGMSRVTSGNCRTQNFRFFDLFKPQKLNVTVTDTKSVQFRRSCHASPEHSVEIVQYSASPASMSPYNFPSTPQSHALSSTASRGHANSASSGFIQPNMVPAAAPHYGDNRSHHRERGVIATVCAECKRRKKVKLTAGRLLCNQCWSGSKDPNA
ncbi:hypothetical protein DFH06DRAFT_1150682 [Mycena polygramma]|nr:hypothetical protein DFH06DRAFT_1150682 [Mycena polygramma]